MAAVDDLGHGRAVTVYIWMTFGHGRAGTALHLDTLTMFLNGEPILYSLPVTVKSWM
jgi:hypothetical protein